MMEINGVYQIIAIPSVFMSGLVVMTLITFREMRNKLFMQIIANISLADLLGNLSYVTIHNSPNGTGWCTTQGFLNLFPYPCSWLWTTILVKSVYDLAVHKKLSWTLREMYTFCWGVPLLITLLYIPIHSHVPYRRGDNDSSSEQCSFAGARNGHSALYIYHMITYYGMFCCSVCYMAVVCYLLYQYYDDEFTTASKHNSLRGSAVSHRTNGSTALSRLRMSTEALFLYPLVMVLLWLPHAVLLMIDAANVNHNTQVEAFHHAGTCLKIMHGFATACIFFWSSKSARTLWYDLLCTVPPSLIKGHQDDKDWSTGRGTEASRESMAEYEIPTESTVERSSSFSSFVSHVSQTFGAMLENMPTSNPLNHSNLQNSLTQSVAIRDDQL